MRRNFIVLLFTHLCAIITAQHAHTTAKSKTIISFIHRAHNSALYKPSTPKVAQATQNHVNTVATCNSAHLAAPTIPMQATSLVQTTRLESNTHTIIKPVACKKVSLLAPYITDLATQKLIAEYCTEWAPYRIFENDCHIPQILVLSESEETLTTIDREKICQWDIQTKKLLRETAIDCSHYSVSPDGAHLACTAGLSDSPQIGGLSVIHLKDHAINKFVSKNIYLLSVAVSSQGKQIAGALYDKIWLINAENNGFMTIDTPGYYAKKIIFSASGTYMAAILSLHGKTSSKTFVRIWDNGTPIDLNHAILNGCNILFTPDEKKLIITSSNLFFLDIASRLITEFTIGSAEKIQNISFSDVYQIICTNHEVIIVDQELKIIQTLAAQASMHGAVFSPHGKYIAIGIDNKIIVSKNKAAEILHPVDDKWES